MTLLNVLGTGLLLGATALTAHGQRTLNAAGGTRTTGGTVHEWSVGETALIQTFRAGALTVTQGVLQPAAAPPNAVPVAIRPGGLTVYPNPATEHLFLEHHFPQPGALACHLLDATGKTVARVGYTLTSGDGTQTLNLHDIAAGTYLLQVRFTDPSGAESASVYTIQKTQ